MEGLKTTKIGRVIRQLSTALHVKKCVWHLAWAQEPTKLQILLATQFSSVNY